jgi:hypothetical protein
VAALQAPGAPFTVEMDAISEAEVILAAQALLG